MSHDVDPPTISRRSGAVLSPSGATGSPQRPPRPRRSTFTALLAVVVLATALWACGSSSKTTKPGGVTPATNAGGGGQGSTPGSFYGPATTVNGPTATIKVIDDDFQPKNLVIKAGTKVTFDATGHNQHDIVPDDPAKFDFSVPPQNLPPGGQASFTFSKPGTYYYYCSLHATATAGDMRGVITVQP